MSSTTPTAAPAPSLLHRLTLPKFLLKEANRALLRPGPYAHGLATSILQDAAEAFLRILASHRGVNVHQNHSFSEVLGKVASQSSTVSQYRIDLGRLNSARVMFKHQGLSALQRNDVIVFAGNVANFLTDACRAEMNIEFTTVSLADAIGHRRTQNWITMAEDSFDKGDFDDALQRASGAMAIYLAHSNAHDSAFDDPWPLSPFVHFDLDPNSHLFEEGGPPIDTKWLSNVSDFARWAKTRIDDIYDRVRLMARGVDMGAYDKLTTIAPRPILMANGPVRFRDRPARGSPTADDVRFCIDTVIDAALALRSNRPPPVKRSAAPPTKLSVSRETEVIVDPDAASPEIIRRAGQGETLEAYSRSRLPLDGDYVAILQDGDVAFVSKHCVEAASPDSSGDPPDG